MFFVGLDVHLKSSAVCILNQDGKVVKQQMIQGSWDQLVNFLRRQPGPLKVVYEASCGYGTLYDKLAKVCHEVVVAHPGELRLIFCSKRKSDRVDAKKLATLLFLDQVPKVWVADLDVRQWREMIMHRQRLVCNRTRIKNRIRALLRGLAIRPSAHGIRYLWSKYGLKWLSEELNDLTMMDAFRRDDLLSQLQHCDQQITRVEKLLDDIAANHEGVRLLQTIPGVGPRTAEAVVAYVDQPDRFASSKKIGSYFGLVPSQDQSGGTNRMGRITRQGPSVVRRLIVEASWAARRYSQSVRQYFERVMRNDKERRKKALVATGHYLLRVMLAMLQTGSVWEERQVTDQAKI